MPHSLEHGFLDLPYTEMVWIEPSNFTFQAGEKVTKQITFEKGFWASKYPVTQEVYGKIMGKNPSIFRGKHRPVERISWLDTQEFLSNLNKKTPLNDGLLFQLPSETMWEYVALTRQSLKYSGSEVLNEVSWHRDNSSGQTMAIGLKEPNTFGLYDLSGNVWEWCADEYEDSLKNTPSNGLSYSSESNKIIHVLRGGSYSSKDYNSRIIFRFRTKGNSNYENIGFRVFRY